MFADVNAILHFFKLTNSFQFFLAIICIGILYLFICHMITITKRCQKKKGRKKWRGGLKETIKLMLIRPPQLQFFEDGIKITVIDKK